MRSIFGRILQNLWEDCVGRLPLCLNLKGANIVFQRMKQRGREDEGRKEVGLFARFLAAEEVAYVVETALDYDAHALRGEGILGEIAVVGFVVGL